MKTKTSLLLLAGMLALIPPCDAAEPTAEAVLNATGIRHGIFVHVGASDGGLAEALAQKEQVLVNALALDPATEAQLRQRFVKAGIHGQATAGRVGADALLPLADNLAAIVVADLDAVTTVKREELLRVLRPLGKAYLQRGGQWSVVTKPRSADTDDWAQYYHDAAMSDLSADRVSGPARGLQWQAGPQDTHSDGVRVIDDVVIGRDAEGLWARDAFSGLPLWRRPGLLPATRFGLLVDSERVYIYPAGQHGPPTPGRCQLALDLRTGKTVLEYTAGLTFEPPAEKPKDPAVAKKFQQDLADRARDFQARLIDGLLIQESGAGLAVLDAKSGKRLWGTEAPEGLVWAHPLATSDTLYAVQGTWARSASYTHWPVTVVERVLAMDLRTGRQRWIWEWKNEMPAIFAAQAKADATPDAPTLPGSGGVKKTDLESPGRRIAVAYNMALDQGRLVFAVRAELKNLILSNGLVRQLVLDAKTGKFVAYGRTPADEWPGGGSLGAGHSGFRVLPVGGRWWLPNIIGVFGSVDPAAPTDASKFDRAYSKLLRPVGCTVYRASPNYLFGSLTTYALDGSGVQHTQAARTTCDVGAFPANGMSFLTPNACHCQPYLPGSTVFHTRKPQAAQDDGRLERGNARAAAAPATATADAWPMYLRDNMRTSWNETALPATLRQAWTQRPAQPPAGLIGQEWSNQWFGQGPVTGLSVAEGVGVLALTDRQEVLAVDPASGAERWRVAVDGRVDSQPTIYRGAVYLGTRAGWLYCLNRDTGALVWRFRAAPRLERMVSYGQLESPWPLFGTVTVDAEGVWAVAGRHNDCDGGLWWWRLDATTGEARASGRFGRDELRSGISGTGSLDFDDVTKDVSAGANSPAVTDGKQLLLSRLYCKRENGTLQPWNLIGPSKPGFWGGGVKPASYWQAMFDTGLLVPGNYGLLCRDALSTYEKKSAYGYVYGRQIAYHADRFVCIGGSPGNILGRMGEGHSRILSFRRLPTVVEKERPNLKEPTKPIRALAGAEQLWENALPITQRGGVTCALAVAGNSVLAGISVTEAGQAQAREREPMPHRLLVLGLADGKQQQEFPLPAKPILGGISAVAGRVYVATEDGSITCFAAGREQSR